MDPLRQDLEMKGRKTMTEERNPTRLCRVHIPGPMADDATSANLLIPDYIFMRADSFTEVMDAEAVSAPPTVLYVRPADMIRMRYLQGEWWELSPYKDMPAIDLYRLVDAFCEPMEEVFKRSKKRYFPLALLPGGIVRRNAIAYAAIMRGFPKKETKHRVAPAFDDTAREVVALVEKAMMESASKAGESGAIRVDVQLPCGTEHLSAWEKPGHMTFFCHTWDFMWRVAE